MAGRIRNEDIALVRERSPIADVVGEYLQLRSAGGGDLKGLCPFHDEKTPSFNVTPSRGLYWCFGCGEGGDVITFVQKMEHLTFVEAVERLAARAGVELRYEEGGYAPRRQDGQRARLIEAHKAAAQFYAEQLAGEEAAIGRRFLAERGFDASHAEHFGVGYAPRGWETLVRHLRGRGFTDRELIAGGLAREGRRGPVDRFRGRLVWPIRDMTGDVIGFGARKLYEDDDGPKYLNTPETPLFKKSTVLYGADLAKKEMARRRQAVIVEGYTDVMACHLAGVTTAVATCGTAFGEEHAKLLRRLLMDQPDARAEIIFTFDGDAAGQRAALRAYEQDQRLGAQTFVAVQPDGLDPCDLRLKHGDAAVRDLIASRTQLFEFVIRATIERYDLTTNEGRLAALDAAAPVVAGIKDAGLRKMYATSLDRWLGIMDERFVLRRIREQAGRARAGGAARTGVAGGRPERARPAAAEPGHDLGDPDVQREWELLKLAVQRPAVVGPAFDQLPESAFTAPPHAAVRAVIAQAGGVAAASGPDWAVRLREAAPNERVAALITRLAVEPLRLAGETDDRYANELLARIWERQLTGEIAALKAKLERLNPVEHPDDYNRLFGDLVALEQQRRVMRERAIGSL
ncbi:MULTISPECIES: DNA primase [Thermomonospora]|uniref:DNA primase n=1 Tax=Thermomonospora curvata (strain ATCC 19995 / DSM 43183 / JCM 3096 / KCTC 9072 / NBRC 15933 / NCIMB 10081 / Henssen B9) TaxID=471852 RepID=D1A9Q3_THECD|nr:MULTISPECIES: DNA primase [Thermomonospora]ACY98739.1 DNA primase [Thermomonospora curvata DSM 43183]PKK12954.1 MAG: DNA primase [Thermomonospora sp. CIF 1]